jgi:hypothetical protein
MLILFAILIFVYNFAVMLSELAGAEPSQLLRLIYIGMFPCAAIWWLKADGHRSTVTALYCQGLFMNIAWFALIPYHVLKTRGARGLLPLLLLVGSFMTARIAAMVIYFLVVGFATNH